MIADQVNALNRAREVAAVANLIRLAAASAATSSSTSDTSSNKMSSSSSSSPPPIAVLASDAASPPPPPPQPPAKRISFGIDSLLSDVRRPPAVQHQAADLSTSSARSNGTTSDDELMDNKSLADSDCCDMDDVDEDIDIEEEEDVQSEASGDTPVGKMPSRPSPTLASMFQHHPALMPSFINHPGLMRGHPAATSGAPGAFGGPVGGPPHGWPLPYGLAAAAWAQHAASQFATSKSGSNILPPVHGQSINRSAF